MEKFTSLILVLSILFASSASTLAQELTKPSNLYGEKNVTYLSTSPFDSELSEDELAQIEGQEITTTVIIVGVTAGVIAGVISRETIQPKIDEFKENRVKQREESKNNCVANGGTFGSRGCR